MSEAVQVGMAVEVALYVEGSLDVLTCLVILCSSQLLEVEVWNQLCLMRMDKMLLGVCVLEDSGIYFQHKFGVDQI